ncbi:MAG: tRNA (adenosine(37)-N6)-threonylcarbamoyltransferase complex transferase subunit TsaD [Verrucomicrobiae bacterium]|nr:tRNA (adenosine(37)-N6)-threonylcarbamoyltransferase complex transferase subunit TsaD [Verrucomicrobiae bacterium]
MHCLGIETSCDETSAAVLKDGSTVLSNVVSSQIRDHAPYGGVVPEIAARNHLECIDRIIGQALHEAGIAATDLDLVAATRGPGLASSLLVGLSTAKGLACALGKPLQAVNHMEGHLLSPILSAGVSATDLFPNVSLIVSGGHTLLVHVENAGRHEVTGSTLDDAAGEAFDKIAKLLGLAYPGGPEIDSLARTGNPRAFDFPRALLQDPGHRFSFSGLKTSVRYFLEKQPADFAAAHRADLCASVQEAIVEVLVEKTLHLARQKKVRTVTVSGGVSCNSRLREVFAAKCAQQGLRLFLADPRWSTDNAAMIALTGTFQFRAGVRTPLSTDIDPNLKL